MERKHRVFIILMIMMVIVGQSIFHGIYWCIWNPYFSEKFKSVDDEWKVIAYKPIESDGGHFLYGIYTVEFELAGK